MVTSAAPTVEDYLTSLPDDRRAAIAAVRAVVCANLPAGYQEGMGNGMIAYVIPLERYPDTYNRQPLCYVSLASQKSHMALYLMCVYGSADLRAWFEAAYRAAGKKLDMGKACLRFKKLDDLPLDLIGQVVARVPVDEYIRRYERVKAR